MRIPENVSVETSECWHRGELPWLPPVSWVTLEGWKERWKRALGSLKSMYTLARCRKFVPGFSLPAFKADALKLYEEVCQGIASDDKTLLRQVPCCSPASVTSISLMLGRSSRQQDPLCSLQYHIALCPTF